MDTAHGLRPIGQGDGRCGLCSGGSRCAPRQTMSETVVEHIKSGETLLAMVVRANSRPGKTVFLTPDDLKQQLGFIVYPRGSQIPRHSHVPIERRIVGTTEVLLVWEGCCTAQIYDDARELVSEVR